jgi:hypothetical protein
MPMRFIAAWINRSPADDPADHLADHLADRHRPTIHVIAYSTPA